MSCSSGTDVVSPKGVGEIVPILFDYSEQIVANESIISAVVTSMTESGIDLSPISLLDGAPMLNIAQPGHVVQWVWQGIAGVLYRLTCDATTSTGQVLQIECLIAVKA